MLSKELGDTDTRAAKVPGATILGESGDVAKLLERASQGDSSAADELALLVYDELRAIASRFRQRERSDHTLQTTAIVHEAYMRIMDQRRVTWQNRAHFLSVAATMMRRVLVNHARDRGRHKRGGAWERIPLDDIIASVQGDDVDLISLDVALSKLGKMDPDKLRLVELRFFAGCSVEETAKILSKSSATVKREWRLAKAWLKSEMSPGDPS